MKGRCGAVETIKYDEANTRLMEQRFATITFAERSRATTEQWASKGCRVVILDQQKHLSRGLHDV